jgi:hypothetical protein
MLYNINDIKKLFKDLGVSIDVTKLKVQNDETELPESEIIKGGMKYYFVDFLYDLTEAEAQKLNKALSALQKYLEKVKSKETNKEKQANLASMNLNLINIINKNGKYNFSCAETELFKLIELSKKAQIENEFSQNSPQAVNAVEVEQLIIPQRVEPATAEQNEAIKKKQNVLYAKTLATLVERFETEINYQNGLQAAARILKNFRESNNPKLNKELISAYEGAIKKAIDSSNLMHIEAEKIKKILPVRVVSILKKWQALQVELDQLNSKIRKMGNVVNPEIEKLKRELANKTQEIDQAANEIAVSMRYDKELFNKLVEPIKNMGIHFNEYCNGIRDARCMYDMVAHDTEQTKLWTAMSLAMPGINRNIFDFLSMPILSPTKVKFPLEELAINIEKFSENDKISQNITPLGEQLKSTLKRISEISSTMNEQQRKDDISIVRKEIIKVISIKDFTTSLDNSIAKPKNLTAPELVKLKKHRKALNDIEILQNKRGKRFRERVQTVLNSAIEFEEKYLLFSNTHPKTQNLCKMIDKLKQDFVEKYKLITDDERLLLDALGEIEPLKNHLLINKIFDSAMNNVNALQEGFFHTYACGEKLNEKLIANWSPDIINELVTKEKKKIDALAMRFGEESKLLERSYRTELDRIEDKIKNISKENIIDSIQKMNKLYAEVTNLNLKYQGKQADLKDKISHTFAPFTLEILKTKITSVKNDLLHTESGFIVVQKAAKARLKSLGDAKISVIKGLIKNANDLKEKSIEITNKVNLAMIAADINVNNQQTEGVDYIDIYKVTISQLKEKEKNIDEILSEIEKIKIPVHRATISQQEPKSEFELVDSNLASLLVQKTILVSKKLALSNKIKDLEKAELLHKSERRLMLTSLSEASLKLFNDNKTHNQNILDIANKIKTADSHQQLSNLKAQIAKLVREGQKLLNEKEELYQQASKLKDKTINKILERVSEAVLVNAHTLQEAFITLNIKLKATKPERSPKPAALVLKSLEINNTKAKAKAVDTLVNSFFVKYQRGDYFSAVTKNAIMETAIKRAIKECLVNGKNIDTLKNLNRRLSDKDLRIKPGNIICNLMQIDLESIIQKIERQDKVEKHHKRNYRNL